MNEPTAKRKASSTGTRIPDPPFFLIWSLPRLWYGSVSGSISLNHLSIFYNISCYNSLVLLTFVSRSSCRITYIYISLKGYKYFEIERDFFNKLSVLIDGDFKFGVLLLVFVRFLGGDTGNLYRNGLL